MGKKQVNLFGSRKVERGEFLTALLLRRFKQGWGIETLYRDEKRVVVNCEGTWLILYDNGGEISVNKVNSHLSYQSVPFDTDPPIDLNTTAYRLAMVMKWRLVLWDWRFGSPPGYEDNPLLECRESEIRSTHCDAGELKVFFEEGQDLTRDGWIYLKDRLPAYDVSVTAAYNHPDGGQFVTAARLDTWRGGTWMSEGAGTRIDVYAWQEKAIKPPPPLLPEKEDQR